MQPAPASAPARRVIVGTAGHIDHGKTALVKALTGIDADRLEEEKRRGITIDLGFAHLELRGAGGEPLQLGFVDVPGHERFVRNMLAGVGGIDLVLFVVAANEGIKPQTREHFEICRLLAVRRGITVLTKADLVDSETLHVVRMELEDFFRDSFLDAQHAPIIAVSSETGAGLHELRSALSQIAGHIAPRDASAYFRLPIDRVFTMKGFGTVVTGTLISGSVGRDEEIEVFPSRKRVRVRGIQVHGSDAERAHAGERTAVNLAGAEKEELARGMSLAAADFFEPTTRIDAGLSLLKSAKPLRHRSRVHLHVHTAETVAEVFLHGQRELAPGTNGYAELRLASPVLLLPEDRFVVRQFSPLVTIGGGRVLDAFPRKQSAEGRAEFLSLLDGGSAVDQLRARIARRKAEGLSVANAIRETGWRREQVEQHSTELLRRKDIFRSGDVLISAAALQELANEMAVAVERFHKAHPLVQGMSREALRERLGARIPQAISGLALSQLAEEKKLEVAGELVHAAGRRIQMKDEEAESKQLIEHAFRDAGLKVPALNEVLAGLKIDRARAQRLVTLLLREKALVKLSEELVFHREALERLRNSVQSQKTNSPKIDIAGFKTLTGVSRKYAIPLLEYLDRERVTRRAGDERIIL